MKDASGKRQQSSFKSFHNKPRNKNILLMGVKNKKCSEVFIEFNTSQFSFSKQEQDEIIEYYVGHCLACGQSFQWERHYKFDFMTNFVED